jgi:hypothetical protein
MDDFSEHYSFFFNEEKREKGKLYFTKWKDSKFHYFTSKNYSLTNFIHLGFFVVIVICHCY